MSRIVTWEEVDGKQIRVVRAARRGELPAHDPAAELLTRRAHMICTPLQGKLALGEAAWLAIETWRDTQATWEQKQIIDNARDWRRTSPSMMLFAGLLGYTEEQMDELFAKAMEIAI